MSDPGSTPRSNRSGSTPRSTRGATTTRQRAKAQSDRKRMLLTALGAVAVVVVIVVVAVFSSQEAGSTPSLADLAGDPAIEGAGLPALPQGDADPAVGMPAPVVDGADFDGAPVALGAAGRPQLIMFLASWCPACQQELPAVVAWQEAGGVPDGVDLVAVSTGLDPARPEWPPTDWFEREGYGGPILVDDADGSVAGAYGLTGTPFWVALDADGRVAARASGMVEIAQLEALARSLLD